MRTSESSQDSEGTGRAAPIARAQAPDAALKAYPLLPAQPRVSVVIPTYNEVRFLRETIDSVLTQDYPEVELVICDGASTDGTVDILHSYDDDPRVVWVSEPDDALAAMNKGIHMATGDLVAIQNANDTYSPGALSRLVIEFQRHPLAAIVGGWTEVVDESGKPTGRVNRLRVDDAPYSTEEILGFQGFTKIQATIFRHDLLVAVGGFDRTLVTPATTLWVNCMLEALPFGGTYHSVPDALATFRLHEGQRHLQPEFTPLAAYRDRKLSCLRLSKRYRAHLSADQYRLFRRMGYFHELRHRVARLHQSIGAIPSALGYVRYGGGGHVLKWAAKRFAAIGPYLVWNVAKRGRASK